jgi:hypothetical protein
MLYKDNLKPKYAFCDDIRDFFKRDDIPDELFNLDIFDASPIDEPPAPEKKLKTFRLFF